MSGAGKWKTLADAELEREKKVKKKKITFTARGAAQTDGRVSTSFREKAG